MDKCDVRATDAFEQFSSLILGKLWIACFDNDEKTIIAGAFKSLPIENGVIPARQLIHCHERKDRGERGKQHGQFKEDGKEGRHRSPVVRFAMHNYRVKPA